MRIFPLIASAAALALGAVVTYAASAHAIPIPVTPGPSAFPTAAPAAATGITFGLGAALAWGTWVLGHWRELGELLALVVALYQAVKSYQWTKLTQLAGELTYNLATLSNFDNDAKRRAAVADLYRHAPAVARALFSEAQFALAVETGWKLIAKPRLANG